MQPNKWRGKVTNTLKKSVCGDLCLFVAASHQTRLDTRSKARRPIKGRGRSGTSRDSNPAGLCISSAHGAMWAWWGKQFHEPKCGSRHVCRFMAWTRQQGLVPYIGFENVRGDLCIYHVPPMHECGTRPFLRRVRSQGRSPQASGKAKNTFDPVGIPLFGAPANKPNSPKGVKAWGNGPPEAGGTLQCRGTPGRTT